MEDKRPDKVREIQKKLLSGVRLSESDVCEYLHLARDASLLVINQAILRDKMPGKPLLSTFNSLQNAVERYDIIHQTPSGIRIDEERIIGYEYPMAVPPKSGDSIEA